MALPHHPRFLLVVGVSSEVFPGLFISGVFGPKISPFLGFTQHGYAE